MLSRVFVFLLLTLPLHAFAEELSGLAQAQQRIEQQQLWNHREWLGLLHFGNDHRSDVDDKNFFFATDGDDNPQAEMQATLRAFYAPHADDDQHPLCRYPARFAWLNKQLDNALSSIQPAQCALYHAWRHTIPDQRLTLIFPAYHLNSPSSMFGHTLLRLDPANVESHSDWLSIAVNFGAHVTQDDNSLLYAYKGLAGGYPGIFIVTPYFKKIREYNRDENRDIWEYPLNLRPDEIRFMVTHLWELKEIQFDYYFFDENCSYRLLELLEVARPSIELTDQFDLTAIPVDTVRAIEDSGLIQDAQFRPSQVTELQNLIQSIPKPYHALTHQIASNPDWLSASEFQNIDVPTQRNMVDAAYKYLRYQQGRDVRDDINSKNSYRLLAQLNSYPIVTANNPSMHVSPPENGHHSQRLNVLLGKTEDQTFAEMGWRPSFHSLEDNVTGFLQGAQINMGNIQLRIYENQHLEIQQLDLVDIFSITPRSAFMSPWSWRVYTGLERQPAQQKTVLTKHLTAGAGVAYAVMDNNLFYLLASLRLENNSEFDQSIEPAMGVVAGVVHHFQQSTLHLQFNMDFFEHDYQRQNTSIIHNVTLATHHAIRLQAKHTRFGNAELNEYGMAYHYFF